MIAWQNHHATCTDGPRENESHFEGRARASEVVKKRSRQLTRHGDGMADEFILGWVIDGETVNVPYPTQKQALQRAEALFREHGSDLEIALHLKEIELPSILFTKKRMRDWCRAGYPIVQI
jgi:hypothetical protein